MSVRRFPFLLSVALLGGALAALYVAVTHRNQRVPLQLFGRYNEQQILARTEPLCHLFMTPGNNLRLSASQQELQTEPIQRYWMVDCTDEAGNYIASFSWNADSGDLYVAGHPA